jgi:hypothetical protein
MEIKTTHIIIGLGVIALLSQGENVRSSMERTNQERTQRTEFSDRIRQNRMEERQAEQLSKVALARYKNNCVLVVDQATGKESYFQPEGSVIDQSLGRTVRPGLAVCNRLGDTALVSQAGTITDIARITTPDLPPFKKLLAQRRK